MSSASELVCWSSVFVVVDDVAVDDDSDIWCPLFVDDAILVTAVVVVAFGIVQQADLLCVDSIGAATTPAATDD